MSACLPDPQLLLGAGQAHGPRYAHHGSGVKRASVNSFTFEHPVLYLPAEDANGMVSQKDSLMWAFYNLIGRFKGQGGALGPCGKGAPSYSEYSEQNKEGGDTLKS